MAATQSEVLDAAKRIAQDSSTSPLLSDHLDYPRAIEVALLTFDQDVPNVRIVHHTVTAAAFRFILAGSGALAGLTGLDAWSRGRSVMQAVWHVWRAMGRECSRRQAVQPRRSRRARASRLAWSR